MSSILGVWFDGLTCHSLARCFLRAFLGSPVTLNTASGVAFSTLSNAFGGSVSVIIVFSASFPNCQSKLRPINFVVEGECQKGMKQLLDEETSVDHHMVLLSPSSHGSSEAFEVTMTQVRDWKSLQGFDFLDEGSSSRCMADMGSEMAGLSWLLTTKPVLKKPMV